MAVSLIGLSTCQFLAVGIASGRALADVRYRRACDLRGLRQAAQIARLNSELKTSHSSSSVQWRVMEVAEIIDESSDCRSFYLIDPYRQPLPDFQPGQHLMVRPALAGAYQTTRCYSISSSPDARYWRITVKRQSPQGQSGTGQSAPSGSQQASGNHQGGLSAWLHETIGVGDCLLIGGPNGHFFVPHNNPRPLVLLAAGVGITPMASMLRWSMQSTPQRPVHILYQARDIQHWPLGQTLHSWARRSSVCQVTSFFSRANRPDLTELTKTIPPRALLIGKFDASHALQSLPDDDCDYFLCGPNAWMEELRTGLLAASVPENRIHWESFGSVSNPVTLPDEKLGTSLSVSFAASGVDAQWNSADHSLWELAREHQVDIPSGCLSGVCGCCRVKLLSGQVTYDREVSIELAEDECLACIARPKTDCRIDA